MLVNQLPFFILNDLFILAKTAIHGEVLDGLSLIELVISLMRDLAGRVLLIQKNILEQHFSKAEHMLDLLRLCLEPSDESDDDDDDDGDDQEDPVNLKAYLMQRNFTKLESSFRWGQASIYSTSQSTKEFWKFHY